MSLLEYNGIINFGFPYEAIYACLDEAPPLTVVIGAKCSDGVVLIADKKLTDIFGGKPPEYKHKLSGDLGHFLIGYTGLEDVFHIFRKSIIGDWLLTLNTEPYTFNNFITRCCPTIRTLNGIARRPALRVLVAKHQWNDTQLYYIDDKGIDNKIDDYIAIGSSKGEADNLCKSLSVHDMTMKDFAKHAYFAIMFMNQYHPGLGVGVEPDGAPGIKYLHYEAEWDKEATPEDIKEYKQYTNQRLEGVRRDLEVG